MKELEFYIFEDELWVMSPDGNRKITEHDTEVVKSILDRIRECYPDAYNALVENYKKASQNVPYYQWLMANRFCRCNFGELDSQKRDIDCNGAFNFEKVKCPLRGECKYEGVICSPKFSSKLSEAQLRVMKLLYEGYSAEQVADELFISVNTVANHRKTSYLKLGVNSIAEFIQYANRNNLFV